MILTNPTHGDVDLISQLGDSLKAKREVYAAHVCYLCAEQTPELVESSSFSLIGLDNVLFRKTHFTPHSIQRTEILEYARAQSSFVNSIHGFHVFKLGYAQWLAESGDISGAAKYCESLARQIQATPDISAVFSLPYLLNLDDFASRLRYEHHIREI